MLPNGNSQPIQLKGGLLTWDRKLDRIPSRDARNGNYPLRTVLAADSRVNLQPRSYTWPVGTNMHYQTYLDQGQEGACVGFAFAHELLAKPQHVIIGEAGARDLYRNAQLLDEWPGEDYEGTSVLAGAKVVTGQGYYKSYSWTSNAYELAVAVSRFGPAVLGINWYENMYNVNRGGWLIPSGEIVGGHAILCKGYNKNGNYFILHNSWGEGWGMQTYGLRGCGKVEFDAMQYLLNQGGEACLPSRNPYPVTPSM